MENKLWALLVPGPDDLWPMPSREAADEAAKRHNEIVDADDWPYPELRESSRARVVEWPYGAESHAELLESGESEVLSSNELGIPDGAASALGLTPNAEFSGGEAVALQCPVGRLENADEPHHNNIRPRRDERPPVVQQSAAGCDDVVARAGAGAGHMPGMPHKTPE